MADVFISYAREDREMAKRFSDAVEARGWTVWWDRRIPAGKSYEDVIEQAIDEAGCVIVLWTRKSIISEWVRNEAGEGARRHVLIPIRLEDVRLPLAFRHLQADDLLTWTPAELDVCLASVESMIGAPTKPPKLGSVPNVVPMPVGPSEPEVVLAPATPSAPDVAPAAERPLVPDIVPDPAKTAVPKVVPPPAEPSMPNPRVPEVVHVPGPPDEAPAPLRVPPIAARNTPGRTEGETHSAASSPPRPMHVYPATPSPPTRAWKWVGWTGIGALGLATFFTLIAIVAQLVKDQPSSTTTETTSTETSTTGTETTADTAATDTSATSATGVVPAAMDETTMKSPNSITVISTATTSTSRQPPAFATGYPVVMKDAIDLQTTAGTITIELFPGDAPNHVSDFLKVVAAGGFDGASVYHIYDEGIALGTTLTGDIAQEPNRLAFLRGTVMGMGRENGADASGLFYISTRDYALDRNKNTVFGRVIAGMDVVDVIARSPVDDKKHLLKPITITQAVPRKRD